jgi:cell wall-associated NlpC family hydrolase
MTRSAAPSMSCVATEPAKTPRAWRLPAALAVAGTALALSGCGKAGPQPIVAEAHSSPPNRIREERPPRPRPPYDVAPRPQKPPPSPAPEPKPEPEAKSAATSSIAPASAGTNGSFVPHAAATAKTITPRSMAKLYHQPASQSAILLNGIALAPPSAPEAIKAAITAANTIVGRPYVWGGGHASWYSRGYDCSGAVSYALGGGGFLSTPLNSSQLESWGEPGPGRWLTVYASASHTYAVIAGLRWDTVGDARGTGPRWHPALPYPQGFVARHPPGY